jgi:RNA polymerase sigma-70 factor (ECF subfamily)
MSALPDYGSVTTAPTAADEALLVERLCRGDEAAFETLVREYGPRMLAVARRYLPRETDAEDALQDAFLSAHRNIASFRGGSRLGTWLHRVTVNAALMRIRSRRRRPEPDLANPSWRSLAAREGPLWTYSPTETVGREEIRRAILDGLASLPEDVRAVVRLRDIEGVELGEIGTLLGIGLSTVKSRLHRGRSALRDCLNGWGRAG